MVPSSRWDLVEQRYVRSIPRSCTSQPSISAESVQDGELVPPPVEFEKLANTLEALPIPSICALQGSVYAGGLSQSGSGARPYFAGTAEGRVAGHPGLDDRWLPCLAARGT